MEIDKILCMRMCRAKDLIGVILTPEQQKAETQGELLIREIILERDDGKSPIVVGGVIITAQEWRDLVNRQTEALESDGG